MTRPLEVLSPPSDLEGGSKVSTVGTLLFQAKKARKRYDATGSHAVTALEAQEIFADQLRCCTYQPNDRRAHHPGNNKPRKKGKPHGRGRQKPTCRNAGRGHGYVACWVYVEVDKARDWHHCAYDD